MAIDFALKYTNNYTVNCTAQNYANKGFTLLELLVTLATFLIAITVVAPSGVAYLQTSRMTADINHLSAILKFARTKAINDFSGVTVCPSSDFLECSNDWSQHIIVFQDSNQNNIIDKQERLLLSRESLRVQHKIKGPNRAMLFRRGGITATPASFILCPMDNNNKLARALIVSLQGRVRVSIDSNKDQIHELASASNIDCKAF